MTGRDWVLVGMLAPFWVIILLGFAWAQGWIG